MQIKTRLRIPLLLYGLSALWISLHLTACATSPKKSHPRYSRKTITVIGHRGASGHRPEHTLASYELAIDQGADFIEPDLVITKDGALIARHENEISGTTDVATKFPARRRTQTIDGKPVTGWFAEDFTLAEIKTLRAKERLSSRDPSRNGRYEIPTLREVIDLAIRRSRETGRTIGIYPETKHPTFFRSIGKPLEPRLVAELKRVDWTHAQSPVIIQSFELSSLQELKTQLDCRLVFLLDEANIQPYDDLASGRSTTYGDYLKPKKLKNLVHFLYGIGPYKRLIIPQDVDSEKLLRPTSLIEDAHRAGLKVHPYTFRGDAPFLASEYDKDPKREYRQFYELGVDGVFTDFPDEAVAAF